MARDTVGFKLHEPERERGAAIRLTHGPFPPKGKNAMHASRKAQTAGWENVQHSLITITADYFGSASRAQTKDALMDPQSASGY